MQVVPPPPDVTLTWALQTAMALGFSVAAVGLAWAFRRPAMRALAIGFVLTSAASGLIWLALAARSLGLPDQYGAIFTAVALPLTPVLTFVVLAHLVRLLEGRVTSALPAARTLWLTGGAALAISVTLVSVTTSVRAGSAAVVGGVGSVASMLCYAVLVGFAVRARRGAVGHRAALTALAISFVLMTARSTTNIVVTASAITSGDRPRFSATITTTQMFLLALIGALQLVAVLAEERATSLRQAEQVRQAEASGAASQRLESLGRMAGAVAHDFNNILSVITLSADGARSPLATLVQRDEDLLEIGRSARAGRDLTKQLMAFARSDPERVERFDANARVVQLRGMLQRLVRDEVVLTLTPAAAPQIIEMDATQFEQVVMNLVINARDAISGPGRIDVRLAPADADGRGGWGGSAPRAYVQLSVTDSGPGIPPEVLPHIFEPFFSTKETGEGAGLGLATCDGIVRRAGGHIQVHTEAGVGTRFEVLLPAAAHAVPDGIGRRRDVAAS
jgi:signal transduction histidine kinase